jgi:hypothetical protein
LPNHVVFLDAASFAEAGLNNIQRRQETYASFLTPALPDSRAKLRFAKTSAGAIPHGEVIKPSSSAILSWHCVKIKGRVRRRGRAPLLARDAASPWITEAVAPS